MNPTEYWQERLEQERFDHEMEVERLKRRITELEEALEAAKRKLERFEKLPVYDESNRLPK